MMSFLYLLCCCGAYRRLDYDSLPDHTYNFTVTATDNGVPALSGSANVRVSVTNVNDEDPVFVQSTVEHIQVSEDALPNTVIHVLQAYDPDGDGVTYSFAGMVYAMYADTHQDYGIGQRKSTYISFLCVCMSRPCCTVTMVYQ